MNDHLHWEEPVYVVHSGNDPIQKREEGSRSTIGLFYFDPFDDGGVHFAHVRSPQQVAGGVLRSLNGIHEQA